MRQSRLPLPRGSPSLTRPMAGNTHSRYLSPEQAELARQQIEQGHKFRKQVEQYREACEQWADAQLERSRAASTGAAEKGGCKPTNRPSKRNRPGNRKTLRMSVDHGVGFRSGRNWRRDARLCAWQRVRWINGSTRTPAIMWDRNDPGGSATELRRGQRVIARIGGGGRIT
jgi:hypothetical protein